MSRAPWQTPSILFTLLCVFLAGAATGAVTMRFGFPPERHKPGLAWNEAGREITLQKFKKELDLSPHQTEEMERILDDFMTYYQYAQARWKTSARLAKAGFSVSSTKTRRSSSRR